MELNNELQFEFSTAFSEYSYSCSKWWNYKYISIKLTALEALTTIHLNKFFVSFPQDISKFHQEFVAIYIDIYLNKLVMLNKCTLQVHSE